MITEKSCNLDPEKVSKMFLKKKKSLFIKILQRTLKTTTKKIKIFINMYFIEKCDSIRAFFEKFVRKCDVLA
jgi:ABC-type uncharacterized transport system ATPase component